jgi:hypothetical protein
MGPGSLVPLCLRASKCVCVLFSVFLDFKVCVLCNMIMGLEENEKGKRVEKSFIN